MAATSSSVCHVIATSHAEKAEDDLDLFFTQQQQELTSEGWLTMQLLNTCNMVNSPALSCLQWYTFASQSISACFLIFV